MNAVRKKKLLYILGALSIFMVCVALVMFTLRQNISLFFTPSTLSNAPLNHCIRLGGIVQSWSHKSLTSNFIITDLSEKRVLVTYKGVLPDLFKEGQGVVVRGKLVTRKDFIADEVLAKHDEKYMPYQQQYNLKKG